MTKLEGIRNDQTMNDREAPSPSFGLRASFVIRHSSFVICCSMLLMLIAQTVAVSQAASPNVIGKWNVEITFANEEHRSLRFDAQDGEKGTLMLVDPKSKVWGSATPSEAKWTRSNDNSVTFSGAVEFMLGNVGRDAGTL